MINWRLVTIAIALAARIFSSPLLSTARSHLIGDKTSISDEYMKKGLFEEALKILEKTRSELTSSSANAELEFKIGLLYWTIGNPVKALECVKKANSTAEKAHEEGIFQLSEKCLEIISLYTQAKKNRNEKEYEKAIGNYSHAIELARKIDYPVFVMKCLRQMSLVFFDQNDLRAYLKCNESGLTIARELRHRKEEGNFLNNIGLYHYKSDKYSEALHYYELSYRLAKNESNRRGESECLTNIGAIYKVIGQYEYALDAFQKSLKIDRELGDANYIDIDLSNIGTIFRKKWIESGSVDDLLRAQVYFRECLQTKALVKNENVRIRILHNLGTIYGDLKKYQEAIDCFEETLPIAEKISDKEGMSLLLDGLGSNLARVNRDTEAVSYLRKAIALAAEIGAGQVLWNAYFELAGIQKKQKLYPEALKSYQFAMRIIEKSRASLNEEDLKNSFLGANRRLEVFHEAVDLLYRMDEEGRDPRIGELALEFMERAKARGFLDSLELGRSSAFQSEDREWEERIDQLEQEWMGLSSRTLDSDNDPSEKASLEAESARWKDAYDRIGSEIRSRDPRYAALRFPEWISLKGLKRKFLPSGTVIVTYLVGDDSAYGLAIDKKGTRLFPLPSPSFLRDLVGRHMRSVSDREGRSSNDAETLYQFLLGPGLKNTYRRMIVVPDDVLHYLPFETLRPEGEGDMLGVRTEIAYAPSLSSMAEIERRAAGRKKPSLDLLAVASPNRGETVDSISSVLREKEIEEISRYFQPKKRRILKGIQADEKRVKENRLGDFRIIHFAAHGTIDEPKPLRSSIVLGEDPGAVEDGFFRAEEIYGLRLNAGLVVLSSCRSAGGRLMRGEGVVGMNRSFLFAGSSAVLMSLWPVDDEATGHLMGRFYRHLEGGKTVSEALRLAKIEMIDSEYFSHPYYWAGFIATGATARRLVSRFGVRAAVSVGMILLLGSVLIFFIRRKREMKI